MDKTCCRCGISKDEEEFYWENFNKGLRVGFCKDCARVQRARMKDEDPKQWERIRAYRRQHYQENKEARAAASRLYNHGITDEQYKSLLVKQHGLCAICKQPETFKNKRGTIYALAVDHDHVTDQIRGLLCNGCNTAIGSLKDDTERMLAAIEYLQNAVKQRKIVQLALFDKLNASD